MLRFVDLRCSALYLSGVIQVFNPTPAGVCKVVLATNAAETSVTIDGVTCIVDTGMAKHTNYDPRRNISVLEVARITQSAAKQRAGRAGRTRPGQCIRMYTEDEYLDMTPTPTAEILRTNMSQTVLRLLYMGANPMSTRRRLPLCVVLT